MRGLISCRDLTHSIGLPVARIHLQCSALGGLAQDWVYVDRQCMEITLELSPGKWPPEETLAELFNDNLQALLALPLAAAVAGARYPLTPLPTHSPAAPCSSDLSATDPDLHLHPRTDCFSSPVFMRAVAHEGQLAVPRPLDGLLDGSQGIAGPACSVTSIHSLQSWTSH